MRKEVQAPLPEWPHVLPARTGLSSRRVAGAVVLLGWALCFWFLIASERSALYLGARTRWLIPLGALILTAAGVGRLLGAVVESPEPFRKSEIRWVGLLLLPMVFVIALPPASLGSYALGRRSSLLGSGFAGSDHSKAGAITLGDVAWGLASPPAMRSLVAQAGSPISFTGFVSRSPDMPADQFELTRFVITCCVADALSVQVHVVDAPPGRFDVDDWVRVKGNLYPLRDEVLVAASAVTRVAPPEHPYLNP